MNNSLNIGAISGLIAGLLGGIVFTISIRASFSIGLYEPRFVSMYLVGQNAYGTNILIGIIFGIICGVIYSRAYSLILGKGVSKGLFFGLILLLILWIRHATWCLAYGLYAYAASEVCTGFLKWVAYGLVLGFLYDLLISRYYPAREEPMITTYDMRGGVLPGAIAGFLGGLAASLANLISFITGLLGPQAMPGAPGKLILDFWISQSGTHIFLNMFWGIVFGLMFPRVYNVVRSKGVSKGIIYGLTMWLINGFQYGTYWIGWGWLSTGVWSHIVGFSNAIVYGLVLGALYRK